MLPSQPNHNMDELLKAWARKRRAEAGPPLEMDPATRNLLQGEVIRTFRQPSSEGSSAAYSLPLFWRRLLIGGACVAVVLVAAGLWLRFDHERELKLAQDRENKLLFFTQSAPEGHAPNRDTETSGLHERMRRFELGTADRNGGQPAVALAETKTPSPSRSPSQRQPQVQEDLASASAAPAVRDTSRVDLALSTLATDADVLSNGPRFQFRLPAQPARTPVGAISLAMKDSHQAQLGEAEVPVPKVTALEQSTANYGLAATAPAQASTAAQFLSGSQRQGALYFRQIDPRGKYRQNLNSPPTPKVLTTFEVRQTGQNLQIIDADGSVYDGLIKSASQRRTQALSRGAVAAARPLSAQPVGGVDGFAQTPPQSAPAAIPVTAENAVENEAAPPVGFAFRATGTNRTLNQSVVFTGEFEPAPGSSELNQTVARAVSNGQAFGGRSIQQANELSLARKAGLPGSTQALNSTVTAAGASPGAGRIQGQASVGGKDQFRIEAQQVGR